jgi:hypothetical protein
VKSTLWGLGVTLATFACLATALYVAIFGADQAWFVLLLALPCTVGLPSTLGLLLCLSFADGPLGWGLALLLLATSSLLQIGAVHLLRRLRRRKG